MDNEGPNIEKAVSRHAIRPGYQFVGYQEVGLPVYYLRLRAVVMARKGVPPISEYVLRCIGSEFREEDELAGILGVDGAVIRRALVDLRASEEIDLVAPVGFPMQQWSLTQKGKTTVETAERVLPEEVTLPVYFDGILRRVVKHATTPLLRSRELREADCLQLAPIPPQRPEAEEITVADVNDILKATLRPGGTKRDLLVVKSVLKSDLLFQPAIMLVFQSLSSSEVQVSFLIDGLASPRHDQAFAAGDGPRIEGITQTAGRRTAEEIAGELLPDLQPKLAELKRADVLQRESREAMASVTTAKEHLNTVTDEREREKISAEIRSAEKVAHTAKKEIDGLSTTLVEMYEHRGILDRAIRESQHRVMINSPWITSRAVDHGFLQQLERRLRAGLQVYIAYGLGAEQKRLSDADHHAMNTLRNLRRTYSKHFMFTCLGDTHAKILISDSAYLVVTSFNWLSFRGDRHRTFRDERGVMVRDPIVINDLFDRIFTRMKETEAKA